MKINTNGKLVSEKSTRLKKSRMNSRSGNPATYPQYFPIDFQEMQKQWEIFQKVNYDQKNQDNMLLTFKKNFVPKIWSGQKITTIRKDENNRLEKDYKIHMWCQNPRNKHLLPFAFAEAKIHYAAYADLNFDSKNNPYFEINGQSNVLQFGEQLWQNEGFKSKKDFHEFFKNYEPGRLKIIRWHKFQLKPLLQCEIEDLQSRPKRGSVVELMPSHSYYILLEREIDAVSRIIHSSSSREYLEYLIRENGWEVQQ